MEDQSYSPREFMKMRRPERFSDSVQVSESQFNSSIFEYKLDSITNRNQERDFETFCVQLAQFEICPNLRVQTGPVGGGDSKADSETYPVSEETTLSCWEGMANGGQEKWAIAISAKKDWLPKIKKDVEGIVSTERGYQKIFFITNQFVPDKKRAAIEDELTKKYAISITLLDRNWIMDRVFRNKREQLAIKTLNLGDGLEEKIDIGPLDYERTKDFNKLNTEIEEAVSKGEIGIQIIKKTLHVAIIGSELQKPKDQVIGLFDRAIRIATEYGSIEQVFDAKYHKAWKSYFWLEDFDIFLQLYDELEQIAKTSRNIYTVERQNNLFHLLQVLKKQEPKRAINIDQRYQLVMEMLEVFINDQNRPSAALQAEFMSIYSRLTESGDDVKAIGKCFNDMKSILDRCDRMIGFPYEDTIAMLQDLGDAFGDFPEYEELVLKIIEVDTKRKGELPAAISLFNFGIQQLNAKRTYKAIDYIGRALIGLYKEESKHSFIEALMIISIAYERAGLLWAARGALINAASYATNDFWTYNEVNENQVEVYNRLKKIELRLGRIGYAMEWHQLDMMISHSLKRSEEEINKLQKEINHFGHLMGLVLIKTPSDKLPGLEKLPDVLFNMDLDFGAFGLLYLLNGATNLPEQFEEIGDQVQLNAFFSKWLSQPAQHDLAKEPLFYDTPLVQLQSRILGTEFIINSENKSPGIEIGETLLAAIESFLSTLISYHAVSRIQKLEIFIKEILDTEYTVKFTKDDQITNRLHIQHSSFSPHRLAKEQQDRIGEVIFETIAFILANYIAVDDLKNILEELFKKEKAMDRSLNFLTSLVTLGNVLGYQPKRSISDWISGELTAYPYEPDENRVLRFEGIKDQPKIKDDNQEMPDWESISHADMETLSIVDEPLWVEARWGGLLFAIDTRPIPLQAPIIALMFWDGEKAKEVFKRWEEAYGKNLEEHMSLTILKGINKLEPYWYRMVINPKFPEIDDHGAMKYTVVSRCTTMTPSNPTNLNNFLKSYEKFGHFDIIPAKGGEGQGQPQLYFKNSFTFKEINVRYAWEVGLQDLERSGIDDEFEPYIPVDVENAPILEIFKERINKT